jgi:murein DD-endopeptidase MepM/ murein hydrolase activator NlpD
MTIKRPGIRALIPEAGERLPAKTQGKMDRLPAPTLDERVSLYLKAVHGKQDLTNVAHSNTRNLLLDAMAASVAAERTLPEEIATPNPKKDSSGQGLPAKPFSNPNHIYSAEKITKHDQADFDRQQSTILHTGRSVRPQIYFWVPAAAAAVVGVFMLRAFPVSWLYGYQPSQNSAQLPVESATRAPKGDRLPFDNRYELTARATPPNLQYESTAVPANTKSGAAPAQAEQQVAMVSPPALQVVTPDASAAAKATDAAMPSFRWPARGRVISGSGAMANGQQNDGINLALSEGTPVHAAEDGVVAYAGSEKGYGNLVLIRHSNGFVTAYAHASEILVKRGDQVRRGQVIAKSGQTGNVTSPQLHFEIRKDGAPVDPTQYLPGA